MIYSCAAFFSLCGLLDISLPLCFFFPPWMEFSLEWRVSLQKIFRFSSPVFTRFWCQVFSKTPAQCSDPSAADRVLVVEFFYFEALGGGQTWAFLMLVLTHVDPWRGLTSLVT